MFKNLTLFAARVINKLLIIKRKASLIDPANTKNALLSYVLIPSRYIPFYFKTSHNNAYHSYLLSRYLKSQGYNVYLHNYLDENIDYTRHYDLFIGHNLTFASIAKKLKGPVKTLLLGTGSYPQFGNEQQHIRILDVNKRKGADLPVFSDNIVSDLTENYNTAGTVAMLGNEFVKHTYPKAFHSKIVLINNVTLHPYFKRQDTGRKNSFLFISSVGQVHRGLDLLLDVFSKLDYTLYVLSAFHDEKEFIKLYDRELFHTPNIVPIGFIDLGSKKFRDIINAVDFTILPSCSEGQSSLIINMLMYDLIPVIPDNVGITDVDNIGVKIETIDIDGVEKAVRQAISLSDEAYKQKQLRVKEHARLYTGDAFVHQFDQIIKNL